MIPFDFQERLLSLYGYNHENTNKLLKELKLLFFFLASAKITYYILRGLI